MKYALFCLLLSGCLFSNDKTTRDSGKAPYYRYSVAGDSTAGNSKYLFLYSDFQPFHCDDDVLVEDPPQRMAQFYRLRGDSLDFWFTFAFEDSSLENHDVYARSQSSTSLAGQWRRVRSASANPNHVEVPDWFAADLERRDSAYQNESMVITEDSLMLSYDRTPEGRIWDLIGEIPKTITHEFQGQYRTIFTKQGGSQVTFQVDPAGKMTVTSSDPGDQPYVAFEPPGKCPIGDLEPEWYKEFFELQTNEAPRPKRSAGSLRRD